MRNKTKIFIVDDNEYSRIQLAQELHKLINCNVVAFASATDCMKELYRDPDIVLSDYYLGDHDPNVMNGGDLLMKIKKDHPNIPVIMYSSRASSDTIVNLIKNGAADFIPKQQSKGREFIQRIGFILKRELNHMHQEYIERRNVGILLVSCILFIVAVFVVNHFAPEALPYFMLSTILIGGGAIFFGEIIGRKIKKMFPG